MELAESLGVQGALLPGKRRVFKRSLRGFLTFWLVIVQVLTLAIVLGAVFVAAKKAILTAEGRELESYLAAQEAVIGRWLERERLSLRALAREVEGAAGVDELRRKLAERQDGASGFDNLAFYNSRGRAEVLVEPLDGVSPSSVYSEVVSSKNAVAALRSDETGESFLVLGVPVRAGGGPAGTLLGFLSLDRLGRLAYFPDNTVLRLVGSDGVELFSGGSRPAGEPPETAPGRYTVVARRPLWGTPWELVAVCDTGPLLGDLTRYFLWILLGVVPGFALVAALALRAAAPVRGFLQGLADLALRSAAGLECRHVSAEGRGELAVLARAFNTLAGSLDDTRSELEEKVRLLETQKESLAKYARQLEELQAELYQKQVELTEKNRILEDMLATDQLTGLLTRNSFTELAKLKIRRACLSGEPLVFGIIDFDGFKEVNDTHGHAAGDVVLVQVAKIIKGSLRDDDLLGRYGGDEFVLLVPETEPEVGLQVAERIRQRVESEGIAFDGGEARITVSIGLACFRREGLPRENGEAYDADAVLAKLFAGADEALYAAKNGGRNRVVCGSPG